MGLKRDKDFRTIPEIYHGRYNYLTHKNIQSLKHSLYQKHFIIYEERYII